MHKSKLAGFIIDCRTSDLQGAARFWSAALGMPTEQASGDDDGKYISLKDSSTGLLIEVQAVPHESRVHLDIETDNIEAEVERLQALGAVVIGHVRSWCVMQAPTGQRFCVVRKASEDFDLRANRWPV